MAPQLPPLTLGTAAPQQLAAARPVASGTLTRRQTGGHDAQLQLGHMAAAQQLAAARPAAMMRQTWALSQRPPQQLQLGR